MHTLHALHTKHADFEQTEERVPAIVHMARLVYPNYLVPLG